MRQAIISMLVAWALATPLAAQSEGATPAPAPPGPQAPPRSAIGFGFTSTIGSGWQIESAEVSYVRRRPGGVIGAFSAGVRLGTFIDEGAIIGGTRGLVFAPTLAVRSRSATLAELGDEQNPMSIAFDLTLETTGYLATSSPLAVGSTWGAIALLPGVKAGSVDGVRYGLVIGPTAFFGSGPSTIRGLFAFRIEAPLARRERRP